MNPTPEHQLERRMDRALKQLPDQPAPSTLRPRVLALVRATQARAWYRREWWQWPAWARLVFAGFTLSVMGMIAFQVADWLAHDWLGGLVVRADDALAAITTLVHAFQTAGSLLLQQINGFPSRLAFVLAGFALAAYLSAVACGIMWYRTVQIVTNSSRTGKTL